MVPAFAMVFWDAGTCLAAEVLRLTHTAWSLCFSAIAPSQCRVHLWACFFAGAQCCHISPGGHPAGRPLPAVCFSSGSSLDLLSPQVVPYLSPSHAASWHQQPSIRHASPSDPLKHWPRQTSPSNHSYPPYLCISSTLSHPKGVAYLPETQSQPPGFICS